MIIKELWYWQLKNDRTFENRSKKAWEEFEQLKVIGYIQLQDIFIKNKIPCAGIDEIRILSLISRYEIKQYFKVPFTVKDNRNFWAKLFNTNPFLCQKY